MPIEKQIFTAEEMDAAIRSMAEKIIAAFPQDGENDAILVGIQQLGVPLAERLQHEISSHTGVVPTLGKLDISMYRDDIGNRNPLPLIRETDINFDVNDRNIILVDDVLSSGRTIRAALDALTDYGRPRMIRLAVLVDRGEPEFPIRADFVGFSISPPADRRVSVCFSEDKSSSGIFEVDWKK